MDRLWYSLCCLPYHELLYPQYRKPKKQRVTQPKHMLGLSIKGRPERIDERAEYGHWEIDTVLLTKRERRVSLDPDRAEDTFRNHSTYP